ncbi:MAG: DNA-binding NarL/FixJ family response regulator [Crocinitomix sp.]|jgi:DNA-binding NarL/FixJ family response regulator
MKKIKIIFIDTAQLFRKGFALYLNALDTIEVVHDFSSVEELNNCNLNGIDLILFDTYTDEDYFTLSTIQKNHPSLRTLLLSSENRIFENYLFASTNKVSAFLSKDAEPEMVTETIQSLVLKNTTGILFPADIRERLFGEGHMRSAFFSMKELNVLGLLGKGKSTKEAAQILNNSKRTVETHRRRMIERIGCKNIIPVIMYALENNYIRIETQEY